MSEAKIQYDTFVGPLPNEAYTAVTEQFNLFTKDRLVEFAARALHGQKKAQAYAAELNEKLANSSIDELTGVYRRDPTYREVQNIIFGLELSRRESDAQENLMVIFLDVEEFKTINDESWALGDRALRTVGNSLIRLRRSSLGDFPGRIGGDEFLQVVRFNTDKVSEKKILQVLEDRIRKDMPALTPGLPSLRWHHAFYRPGDSAESLIARAEPKGSNKALARSHRQDEFKYKQALFKARQSEALYSSTQTGFNS